MGQTLREMCDEFLIPNWRRATEILVGICQAVASARIDEIEDLEIEPEALWVEPRGEGTWKVTFLDAGAADLRGREPRDTEVRPAAPAWLTLPRVDYFSPERLMGKPLDHASDVYTLGVIGFELVTGRRPFQDAKGPAGLITAIVKEPPPVPSELAREAAIPRALDAALLACLDKDRSKRYPDPPLLAKVLQHILLVEDPRQPAPGPPSPFSVIRPPVARPASPRPKVEIVDGGLCGAASCTRRHRFRAPAHATIVGAWCYLDHFDSRSSRRPDAGPHPHQGMTAITYLFEGRLLHRDSLGNDRMITQNTLSWLHAGRGVMHSERMHPFDRGRHAPLHGLELWAVLPRPNEDDPPSHGHHVAGELPSVVLGGARVRVVLGEGFGERSEVPLASPLSMFDVRLAPGSSVPLPLPRHHDYQRAVFVVAGAVEIEGARVEPHQLAVISPGAEVDVRTTSDGAAHVIILGSAPWSDRDSHRRSSRPPPGRGSTRSSGDGGPASSVRCSEIPGCLPSHALERARPAYRRQIGSAIAVIARLAAEPRRACPVASGSPGAFPRIRRPRCDSLP